MASNYTTKTASLRATKADVRKLNTKVVDSELIKLNGKNILDYISENKTTVFDERGENITENDLWGTEITTDENGAVVIQHKNVENPNKLDEECWNSNITKVENNKAYIGQELYANIQTDEIKNGFYMFNGCSNLTSFNSSLKSLQNAQSMFSTTGIQQFTSDISNLKNGTYMFDGCENLTSFDSELFSLQNAQSMFTWCGFTSFDKSAYELKYADHMFSYCKNLTEIPHFTKVESARWMFSRCDSLQSVDVRGFQNLKQANSMFSNCKNLNEITINLPVLESARQMFFHCPKLSTVLFYDASCLKNAREMFEGCQSLINVQSDDGYLQVTDGRAMFLQCSSLKSVCDFPVLQNGEYMFSQCSSLETFTNNISSLERGNYMFYKCPNLTTFTSSLDSLSQGMGMFQNCESLKNFQVSLNNLVNGWLMFADCSSLKSFKSNLSELVDGTHMFSDCSSLEEFYSDLTSLTDGTNMFSNCSSLGEFRGDLSSLLIGSGMFGGKLSVESLMYIADTIKNLEESGHAIKNGDNWTHVQSTIGRIDIFCDGDKEMQIRDEVNALCQEISDKGWIVYQGWTVSEPLLPTPMPTTLDDEEPIIPTVYYYKPIIVDETHAEYVNENNQFVIVVGGQNIYGDDISTYGMFTSKEEAVAQMRLKKIGEKEIETA